MDHPSLVAGLITNKISDFDMRIYFHNHITYLKIGLQDARKYAQKRKKYFEKQKSDEPFSQTGYYTRYKDIQLYRQACVYCPTFLKSENQFTTGGIAGEKFFYGYTDLICS